MTRAIHTISSSVPTLRYIVTVLMIIGFGQATLARADGPVNDSPDVKYRQTVMSNIGSNMGGIGDILKNRLNLPGHIAVHAKNMADTAQLIGPAFKKNVKTDATDAKPEIWQDWPGFETAIADFEQAARDMAAAAESGDAAAVGVAVKALGKSGGGCHKPFRKPKEESYHRMSGEK